MQFVDKIARRRLSKSVERVADKLGPQDCRQRGIKIYIPRKFPAVRSEYDAVLGLLLRWRFKSCHDSLWVLNVSGRLLVPHQRR